ncbi:MAG: glycoside hydrolase [Gammaproteobacteria bacterium]|nr:MAG: glycoside hydrolase [Gammaproteobacteria bacterium]
MSGRRLKLVLCWHMHQPWYREGLDGEFRLPWVYLHALKDYSDMAAHLEAHPGMHAVVNFAPTLLEQLTHYAEALAAWRREGTAMPDPLLNWLAEVRPIPRSTDQRRALVSACMRAHAPHMIDPWPPYRKLLDLACGNGGTTPDPERLRYLDDHYFLDLLTWYHLAWLGHSVKRNPLADSLLRQGNGFTSEQRQQLLALMEQVISGIVPRYRALAERGQIELSFTPYAHPIVPLLIDFESMRCAQPDAPAPQHARYPGGEDRARWQLTHGLSVFEAHFGRRPEGCWLSEGGVSDAAVALLDELGLRWTASGEGVWHNSCQRSGLDHASPEARRRLFAPHRLDDKPRTDLFFRDDGLSDLIGFEYQRWHADDAVADFIHHLRNIADFLGEQAEEHVVSIILDGENAWEYYPDNGYHFLDLLYQRLEESDFIETTTFGQVADCCPPQPLPTLCAGSWVYGSFSTWIGDPAKNRAWDLLCSAKEACDAFVQRQGGTVDEALLRQLAICEGSDWFWWFGDYNPSDTVRDFDALYRSQLRRLYRMLGEPIPDSLYQPISIGGGSAENAGTMRRGR